MIEYTDKFNELDDITRAWCRGYQDAFGDAKDLLDSIIEWLQGEEGYEVFSEKYFNDLDNMLSAYDVDMIKACLLYYLNDRREYWLERKGLKK